MFEPFVINEINVNPNNFVNKNKNIKNNVYEINPIYKNTNTNTIMDNYYESSNIGYDYGDRGDRTNKTKKTITLPRREKMEFIPIEVKKRANVHSVEKLKNSKNMKINNNYNNMNSSRHRKYKEVDDNNIYINEQDEFYNQTNYNNKPKYNNVLNKFKKPKMSSSMDKQYTNDRYNNGIKQNTKNNKKIHYFMDDNE